MRTHHRVIYYRVVVANCLQLDPAKDFRRSPVTIPLRRRDGPADAGLAGNSAELLSLLDFATSMFPSLSASSIVGSPSTLTPLVPNRKNVRLIIDATDKTTADANVRGMLLDRSLTRLPL